MSAYSNLAGLYPPKGNQIWNPEIGIKWQHFLLLPHIKLQFQMLKLV